MPLPLKLGFIGGGIHSAVGNVHFIASQMDGKFQVVSGCFSRNLDLSLKTGEKWSISSNRCYNSISQFLEKEQGQLDAVVVLTPIPDHLESVAQVLRAGLPVICEKSLASTSDDAVKIQELQQEYKQFLMITFNYLGYPMLKELKLLIEEGVLGKLKQIQIEMPQEGFIRTGKDGNPLVPQSWRLKDGLIPTIALDLGTHLHSMINYLTNQNALEVVATQNSFGHFPEIIDDVASFSKFSSDLEVRMWFSKTALGNRNGMKIRLYGEKASAEWFQMNPEEILLADNLGKRVIMDRSDSDVKVANQLDLNRFKAGHPAGFIEAFANTYNQIANSLTDFKATGKISSDSKWTVDCSINGLLFLEAMQRSAQEKKWVKVL